MAAPANDNLANAQVVSSGNVYTGTSAEATTESGEVRGDFNTPYNTLWFRWTAAFTRSHTVSTVGTIYDTVLTIYKAKPGFSDPVTSCANLDVVGYDDDAGGNSTSLLRFTATAGVTYYAQISSYSSTGVGAYTFNAPAPAPANDPLANPTILQAGTTQFNGTMAGATSASDETVGPPGAPLTAGATVWFQWTAPSGVNATFTTAGSSHSVYMTVYTAKAGVTGPPAAFGDLDYVTSGEDGTTGTGASVTFTPTAAKTYYIQLAPYTLAPAGFRLNYPSPAATLRPFVTGIPQTFAFTTSGTTITYTGGGTADSTTIDVLAVNSDNVVTTPTGWTLVTSRVVNQGSYLFAKTGGTTTATIDLGGGVSTNTTVVWTRITNAGAVDISATAGEDASASSTTPALTSAALASNTELVLAFAALHRFTTAPTAPTWSTGYTPLATAVSTSAASSTWTYASVAVKTPAGTAAETPSLTWTNPAFDRYALLAAFTPASGGGGPVTHSAAGTAAATSAASGTATAPVNAAGTANGVSTGTGAAALVRAATGSTTGVSTSSGAASLTRVTAGTATGTSTATGAGARTAAAAGTATGVSTSTATCAVARNTTGTAGGVSVASGAATVTGASAYGDATSTSTAVATGAVTAIGAGTAAATSTASGSAAIGGAGATGTATGVSSAAGAPAVVKTAAGTATGAASATGTASRGISAAATAAAASAATATAVVIGAGAGGSANGAGGSAGSSTVIANATGAASGTSGMTGSAVVAKDTAGSAPAISTANGAATTSGAGTSAVAGVSTASGTSSIIRVTLGTASGVAALAATATVVTAATGTTGSTSTATGVSAGVRRPGILVADTRRSRLTAGTRRGPTYTTGGGS